MFYKVIIALLVIGGLAPFTFIKGKDGQPLMSFSDLSMPDTKIPDLLDSDFNVLPNNNGAVYKWKDENGMWQFSSEQPPKGISFSSTVYDQNVNVIKAVETKRSVPKKVIVEKQEKTSKKSFSNLGEAYSPKKIEKLFDDANNLETLLNDRSKQQKQILNNL